ncbi:MAG: hypothetical protein JSR27_01600 [Proteobacteria bacterium]|nr:hypothetical protein [Pseudomonadota bacterium]
MRHEISVSTLAAALLAALGTVPFAAPAATIAVTTTGDSGGSADCTLRQAIASMNTGAVAAGCMASGNFGENDTINFNTTEFPNGSANIITLGGSQLAINGYGLNLAIDASANGNVTIDAGQSSRAMYDSSGLGGSLTLDHLTVRNGKATSNDCLGAANGGGICVSGASLALVDSTVTGNAAAKNGGGIYAQYGNLTLTRSTLSGNSAFNGGGIAADGSNTTLTDSSVSGNSAVGSSSGPVGGGGIYAKLGSVTLLRSTLNGNTASGFGGGILALANLTMSNSTLSGNSAYAGGALLLPSGGSSSISFRQTTVAGNTAARVAGGLLMLPTGSGLGTINMTNSLFASNNGGNIYALASGGVVTIAGSGNLVFGNASSGVVFANAPLTGDPKLTNLGNFGGLTRVMFPMPGSAAIDAITPVSGQCLVPKDQRGVARPQGAGCDIGAVEADATTSHDFIFANGFEP